MNLGRPEQSVQRTIILTARGQNDYFDVHEPPRNLLGHRLNIDNKTL